MSTTLAEPWSASMGSMAASWAPPETSLTILAPASSAARATAARRVSTDTAMPSLSRMAEIAGTTRRSSSSSVGGTAPGRVDSPPTSTMTAPPRAMASASRTARSTEPWRPPSENESGVTLMTPMTCVSLPSGRLAQTRSRSDDSTPRRPRSASSTSANLAAGASGALNASARRTSASGRSTNSRSAARSCGRVSTSSWKRTSSRKSRSRSISRGPHLPRSCLPRRCSMSLSAFNAWSGSSVVSRATTALRNRGWSSTRAGVES
mmetsp:Transcript_20608/g.73325  ORF Transcript_20608/g.73325 Transcript_20608/m.73325 type:complete len:264 (-) Transcript_20608:175-966(-)